MFTPRSIATCDTYNLGPRFKLYINWVPFSKIYCTSQVKLKKKNHLPFYFNRLVCIIYQLFINMIKMVLDFDKAN